MDNPIPTPFLEHWRRARFKTLHTVGFLVVCCAIALVWRQMAQPLTFPGEVEVVQANVISGESGLLTNLAVTSFQQVKAGDILGEVVATEAYNLHNRLEAIRERMRIAELEMRASHLQTNDPIRQTLRQEEEKLQKLEEKLKPMPLRAPISGTITALHRQPGEHVLAGHPILTITAQEGQRILGFVPPSFPIIPQPGMEVEIRTRPQRKRIGRAQILGLGPNWESVTNVLANANRLPFTQPLGRPVSISLPEGCQLLPGEPVEITLTR